VPELSFRTLEVQKLYPLAISRGVMSSSENLFVSIGHDGHVGIGELSPATGSSWTAPRGQEQLEKFVETSGLFAQALPSPHDAFAQMRAVSIDPPAMAALDVALWDLLGKMAGMPLIGCWVFLAVPCRRASRSASTLPR
jgi:L-Ala-D/L-Glu epimerase